MTDNAPPSSCAHADRSRRARQQVGVECSPVSPQPSSPSRRRELRAWATTELQLPEPGERGGAGDQPHHVQGEPLHRPSITVVGGLYPRLKHRGSAERESERQRRARLEPRLSHQQHGDPLLHDRAGALPAMDAPGTGASREQRPVLRNADHVDHRHLARCESGWDVDGAPGERRPAGWPLDDGRLLAREPHHRWRATLDLSSRGFDRAEPMRLRLLALLVAEAVEGYRRRLHRLAISGTRARQQRPLGVGGIAPLQPRAS